MRLIDADEVREATRSASLVLATAIIDNAPTVDVPQPLTRDGVLAEVARIEAAGDAAVVEVMWTTDGKWGAMCLTWIDRWRNPDVPRWNVRVRAVEVETETVPLTQLVGRTIAGESEPVDRIEWITSAGSHDCRARWRWHPKSSLNWLAFPEGTLNLETGQVAVRPVGEA